MHHVLNLRLELEFGLTSDAIGKADRDFLDSLSVTLDHQLEANLKAHRVDVKRAQPGAPPQRNESTHWIAHSHERPRQEGGASADESSNEWPILQWSTETGGWDNKKKSGETKKGGEQTKKKKEKKVGFTWLQYPKLTLIEPPSA